MKQCKTCKPSVSPIPELGGLDDGAVVVRYENKEMTPIEYNGKSMYTFAYYHKETVEYAGKEYHLDFHSGGEYGVSKEAAENMVKGKFSLVEERDGD